MPKRLTKWLLTAVLLYGCTTAQERKFKQYYLQGQLLYEKHCSNCHQPNGSGLKNLYPPLALSDFLKNNPEKTLCLMRHGLTGEVVVNNITFNQPMPGIPSLTDLEIAEIATYIYNSWGNKRGLVEVQEAERVLRSCIE
ncbi:MAG: hypothetical protein KatS3mg032_1619 [Cyclobacteriaceae bacterium]|nr:MAG: hypothetical protein KatS3mg032_1619 [Cyclobacteriaceae bacterium]